MHRTRGRSALNCSCGSLGHGWRTVASPASVVHDQGRGVSLARIECLRWPLLAKSTRPVTPATFRDFLTVIGHVPQPAFFTSSTAVVDEAARATTDTRPRARSTSCAWATPSKKVRGATQGTDNKPKSANATSQNTKRCRRSTAGSAHEALAHTPALAGKACGRPVQEQQRRCDETAPEGSNALRCAIQAPLMPSMSSANGPTQHTDAPMAPRACSARSERLTLKLTTQSVKQSPQPAGFVFFSAPLSVHPVLVTTSNRRSCSCH